MHRGNSFALFPIGESERVLINERTRTTDRNRRPRHVILLHERTGEARHRGTFRWRWLVGIIRIRGLVAAKLKTGPPALAGRQRPLLQLGGPADRSRRLERHENRRARTIDYRGGWHHQALVAQIASFNIPP